MIEREGPIHVSNVMLLDAKGKRTRVGIEREDGKRFRVARSDGREAGLRTWQPPRQHPPPA